MCILLAPNVNTHESEQHAQNVYSMLIDPFHINPVIFFSTFHDNLFSPPDFFEQFWEGRAQKLFIIFVLAFSQIKWFHKFIILYTLNFDYWIQYKFTGVLNSWIFGYRWLSKNKRKNLRNPALFYWNFIKKIGTSAGFSVKRQFTEKMRHKVHWTTFDELSV